MEVRTNSWHYKLYRFGSDAFLPSQTNLCRYFWRVVWGAFIGTLLCAAGVSIVVAVSYAFYRYTATSFMVFGGIGAAMGLGVLTFHIKERWDERKWAVGGVKPEPGLIRSYLRAKKDKVCPLVTFVSASEAKQEESP